MEALCSLAQSSRSLPPPWAQREGRQTSVHRLPHLLLYRAALQRDPAPES